MKKTISLVLAFVLVLSLSVSALAEAFPTTGIEADVVGGGDTQYIDTVIYRLIIPTDLTWNFLIDPQGLSDIAVGSQSALEDLSGGKIYSTAVKGAINKSSVPVKLSVKVKVTGDAASLTDQNDVNTTDAPHANNILMYVQPSGAFIDEIPVALAGSNKGYILTATDQTLVFDLPRANYVISNDGNGAFTAKLVPYTGKGTAFNLGGWVNKNADWNDYVGATASKHVGIAATFTFAANDADGSETYVPEVAGLREDSALTVIDIAPVAPPIGFMGEANPAVKEIITSTITAATPLVINFNFGGTTTLQEINGGNGLPIATTLYSFDDTLNIITFTAARADVYRNIGSSTTATIVLDDGSSYVINFTV